MPVLTREEAQRRARLLDVHRYAIDLDLARGDDVFGSTTVIRFTARESGADTFVEIRPAELHRVVLDGVELDVAADAVRAEGRLPLTALTAGEHELRVEADMTYSHTGEGMHRFTDPADGATYVYTMCCMAEANQVFAAFDQPDLKAVFEVGVVAPADWTVLGNGTVESVQESDPPRWRLAPTPPISTYLLAVAAGPYHSVRTTHTGIPFGLHVRRSLAAALEADAEEILDTTRRCFDRYHEMFDEPYPFDSYDQAFVPEFNEGAMENPGLVVLRDEYVFRSAVTDVQRQERAVIIAHEMAHMWFGDLVTLRWWDDIWLNESFAEYLGYQVVSEATRFTDAWAAFAARRKNWGYEADQRATTHPVAADPGGVPDAATARINFDGISYAKGASALRQLVAWLGRRTFLAGLNQHLTRHRFGNATLADFVDTLAACSERDVHGWADRWLRTTGVDTLTATVIGSGGQWGLRIRHRAGPQGSATADGTRPHRVVVGLYDQELALPGRLQLRDRVEVDLAGGGRDDTPLTLAGPRPDLVLLNDGDLSYAKVRLDPDSWHTALGALSGLPEAVSRAVVWNAARDMVRDAELPPADFLDAVRAHLPHETDIALVQGVLAFAREDVTERYLPADRRAAALATVAATCRDLLRRTEDGSGPGLRLAAVRVLVDSDGVPGELLDWLESDTVPGGPELDAELRWRILNRLSVLGQATAADIEAESARDPGAAGVLGAARCRAARPDPAAKRSAWAEMFDGEPSHHLFSALASGFWQPEQHHLLGEYVPRYFRAATALAARRGPALGAAAVRTGFPTTVDTETLRLAEECLRTRAARSVPALHRALADRIDDLQRVLRVRLRADGQPPARSVPAARTATE